VPSVHLVPIFLPLEPRVLAQLADRLSRIFATTVVLRSPRFNPELSFDSSRGQYNSTNLLEQLLAEPTADQGRILGVASVDLFIPILTYVFGEAQSSGRAAVVSIYRLDNAQYGLPRDDGLLLDRLVKEAAHELGHTYGLVHCGDTACVMRSSTYVEDIDLKSAQFCSACLPAIRAAPVKPGPR
jgi:archaemetzincin